MSTPNSMAVDLIIDAQGLTKRFGEQAAVQDVTFQIPRGTIFGFIGPSGSGKTTTVRLLTGVYQPTAGQARVLGRRPTQFSQGVRSKIGYMPQLFVLYPDLTVWENLSFAASIYGMGLGRGRRMKQALDFVELSDHTSKRAREISAGMQRRLSLAATLVHSPILLFLDEPTAGIDPVLRRKFWDHFKELQEQGRTVFVTTQYVGEAAYCDLIGVMADGRLLMVDTPAGLQRRAFGGDVVNLSVEGYLDYDQMHKLHSLPFVAGRVTRVDDSAVRLVVDEASTAMPELMEWSRAQNLPVQSIEKYSPPFDDVFVELVKEERTNE